jgi:predicted MFS family arabinose efflux permease
MPLMPLSPMTALTARLAGIPRELKLFFVASFMVGISYSMIDSILNNFVNERFQLSGFERSFLEFPRELPGFLVVFVSAALWFLCSRRLGGVAMLLGVAGALLIGYVSPTYAVVVFSLFVYSMGQHLFMPVTSTIGMELAEEGKAGQRLGQLNAVRNLATIGGSLLVSVGFAILGFTFQVTFGLAAVGLAVAAALLFKMVPEKILAPRPFLKLRKEYRLYYLLAVLFGSRKQLFITFGPWVIVKIFNRPTQDLAILLTIGGLIGVGFQPLLGWAIDHLGERFVLAMEAVLLVLVCLGYAFARALFPENVAFVLICCFYLFDQMLVSVNMARATYMKKIALRREDIQPALTAAITLDHVFSIAIALLGGLVWENFGYQYVFLVGVFIAAANFLAALQIRLPAPAS